MDIKILIADDDPIFRHLVCDIVRKEGLTPVEADDGEQAINLFASQDIDLVILDVMMPVYNGWEVLKEIRAFSDVPIIMLTALGEEKNEVEGLRRGADDYIAKPFSYPVFLARLHSLLKKVRKEKNAIRSLGTLTLNPSARKVHTNGEEVELSHKEFSLLAYLMKNPGQVLTREMILDTVWGFDFDGDIRTIDTHVKTLRSKLGSCGSYIKTVRGSGYLIEVNQP